MYLVTIEHPAIGSRIYGAGDVAEIHRIVRGVTRAQGKPVDDAVTGFKVGSDVLTLQVHAFTVEIGPPPSTATATRAKMSYSSAGRSAVTAAASPVTASTGRSCSAWPARSMTSSWRRRAAAGLVAWRSARCARPAASATVTATTRASGPPPRASPPRADGRREAPRQ
ncbi:hypothetical protein ACR6C2_08170 [Streptomyces sp. INA 01156]